MRSELPDRRHVNGQVLLEAPIRTPITASWRKSGQEIAMQPDPIAPITPVADFNAYRDPVEFGAALLDTLRAWLNEPSSVLRVSESPFPGGAFCQCKRLML